MIVGLAVLVAFCGYAEAACVSDTATLFSCAAKKNAKAIELCDEGKTIRYSFGKPGHPEIVLAVPRSQATTYQWKGFGRTETYAVNVPNGDTVYRVFWSFDKLAERDAIEAGVEVSIKGSVAATVDCDPKTVVTRLEGVQLDPEPE